MKETGGVSFEYKLERIRSDGGVVRYYIKSVGYEGYERGEGEVGEIEEKECKGVDYMSRERIEWG